MTQLFFDALIAKSVQSPDLPYFQFHDGSIQEALCYAEMRRKIAAASECLKGHGANEGDIVLIFAQHGRQMVLSFFGAQWHGAVPAFVPPPTAKQDIGAWVESHKALIDRIRPTVIVAEPSCLLQVRELSDITLISTLDVENEDGELGLNHWPISLDDAQGLDRIAFLQHSSGTTGLKKGVMVTYRQLLAQLKAYGDQLQLDPKTASIVSWLPLYHDMGLIAATLLPFYYGLPVTIIETFAWLSNPGLLMSSLSGMQDAYCWLPNFAFRYIAKRTRLPAGTLDLAGVKAVINCSEPCKVGDMEAFINRFSQDGLAPEAVQVCYAMAEYVFAVTQTERGHLFKVLEIDGAAFDDHHLARVADGTGRTKAVVSVGRPIQGVEIRIGDDLADGHVGEIAVRGPSVCNGYFNNKALTMTKFIDGWYKTGDLGFRMDGEIYVTGRSDDLIIVRGKNIYAHDLEELMTATSGVKAGRSVAFGVEDDSSGTQQLILVAEVEDTSRVGEIVMEINARISNIIGVAPSAILPVALDSLSKTTSGKISRIENRKRFERNGFDILRPS